MVLVPRDRSQKRAFEFLTPTTRSVRESPSTSVAETTTVEAPRLVTIGSWGPHVEVAGSNACQNTP